jgi:predicted  nucleic acid-binding Zn-ribbon protein
MTQRNVDPENEIKAEESSADEDDKEDEVEDEEREVRSVRIRLPGSSDLTCLHLLYHLHLRMIGLRLPSLSCLCRSAFICAICG